MGTELGETQERFMNWTLYLKILAYVYVVLYLITVSTLNKDQKLKSWAGPVFVFALSYIIYNWLV